MDTTVVLPHLGWLVQKIIVNVWYGWVAVTFLVMPVYIVNYTVSVGNMYLVGSQQDCVYKLPVLSDQ